MKDVDNNLRTSGANMTGDRSTERVEITLSSQERDSFNDIRPVEGAARTFWRAIAHERGLDPASVMQWRGRFSGLPAGHDRHWCYPLPLQCRLRPGEQS